MKGQHPSNAMAAHFGGHPHHVVPWKKPALEALPAACSSRRVREAQGEEALTAQLYQQIGQLKVAVDWLKKKLDARLEVTRQFVEPAPQCISVRRPCQWLGLSRSGLYDQPAGASPEPLTCMRLVDEPYTRAPCSGVLRMPAGLNQPGYEVQATRVRRLRRWRGLAAI
jgi:putative transposase